MVLVPWPSLCLGFQLVVGSIGSGDFRMQGCPDMIPVSSAPCLRKCWAGPCGGAHFHGRPEEVRRIWVAASARVVRGTSQGSAADQTLHIY